MHLESFQMIDRVVAIDPSAGTIRTECRVPEESQVFQGHFPGYPILPGVLMIEAMAQTGGWLMVVAQRFTRMALLAQVRQAKLRAAVPPGEHLAAEARLLHDGSGYAVLATALRAGPHPVAEAELTYRLVPFPAPELRQHLLAAAGRAGVPANWLPPACTSEATPHVA